jgi:hypothetical protein
LPAVVIRSASLSPDRLPQFNRDVLSALKIVQDFARRYGWQRHLRKPLFESVEIFSSQQELWKRVMQLENLPAGQKMPTRGLAAGVEKNILMTVTTEEYSRIRPEYASRRRAWQRLLAHEMAHVLHERIVHDEPDAMGPRWFFEGFAILAAGQNLCRGLAPIKSFEDAMSNASKEGTGAYICYELALRFFLRRIPLKVMIRKAGSKDFEDWLRMKLPA